MKNLFLITLVLITNYTFAQNCKYEINEIDNITKDAIKVTKETTAWAAFNDEGSIKFSKRGDSYSITIDCVVFVVHATTFEGCDLIFLLENGKEIALKKGKMNYPISKAQLFEMLNSKVVKIHYQYGNNPNDSKSYDREVKTKYAENIINLIKCVN